MTSMYPRAWPALLAGALTLTSTMVIAEQMFVADKLTLNVYAEPDQESERVATLASGDTVETLEQLGNFTRVQLSGGAEGWVGANDLTLEAPAVVRLRALEKEHKAALQKAEKELKTQIDDLEKQNQALQSEIEDLEKAAAAKAAAEAAAKAQQEQRATEVEKLEPARSQGRYNFAWLWAPFVLLAGGAGYAAGYQTLARKIRNKFGGVKIY